MGAPPLRATGDLYQGAIPMTGKSYGDLRVIGEEARRDYGQNSRGWRYRIRMVRVQCKCGAIFVAQAAHVRRNLGACVECGKKKNRQTNRRKNSIRLPSGATLAETALAAGLDIGTVYRRWLRGWPEERLGEPLHHVGPRLGGHADLPERRRTKIKRTVQPEHSPLPSPGPVVPRP